MPSVLQDIARLRRADVEAALGRQSLESLQERACAVPAEPGRFRRALAAEGLSLIAEIKRASPSRGKMADIPEPDSLARAYKDGGAKAVSVLTEPHKFLGRPEDLQQAAKVGLPVIRKDFLLDPYQVWEARAWGASACLLIAAMLETRDALQTLLAACREADLDALVEIHDRRELDLALEAGADIIGVNHRNLHTFDMNMDLFAELRPHLPEGVVTVAESGIHGAADAARMAEVGADAILVGEHLATAANPAEAVRTLLGEPPC